MAEITKAKIKVIDGQNVLMSVGNEGNIPCVFNPTDFNIERSVNYVQHRIPGTDRPVLQFMNGEAETMSVSLLFDTYSAGEGSGQNSVAESTAKADAPKTDVRTFTEPLMKLTTVNEDIHAPSLVEFVWGSISFKGYVQSISQRFTMFSANGTPVRAVVDLSLISNKTDNNIRNSPDRTKARTISEGDRLYAFAYYEYGDCAEWRRIAEINGLDNPRRLEPGKDIIIPPIL